MTSSSSQATGSEARNWARRASRCARRLANRTRWFVWTAASFAKTGWPKRLAPKAYVEDGRFFQHDFVTAYFRKNRATQIEASSAAFYLRPASAPPAVPRTFGNIFSEFTRIFPPHFSNRDPGGCPAVKHYASRMKMRTAQGIAWRFGAWGDLAPEPDPHTLEIVIVHRRGQPVFVDPDGGVRLVWKVPPHELMEHYPSHPDQSDYETMRL